MKSKEEKVYQETILRNLKRRLSKLAQHPDMIDEYLEVQAEIRKLE